MISAKSYDRKGRLESETAPHYQSDPYVQAPDFTQSFNRYAYCWNNPFSYTDPSGEFVMAIAAIGVSAAVGSIGALAGMATGAAAGAVSGMVLGSGNAWAGGAGFGSGLLQGLIGAGIGAVTGAAIGGITGGINAKAHSGDFWTGDGAVFEQTVSVGPTIDQYVELDPNYPYSDETAQALHDKYFINTPGLRYLKANDYSLPTMDYEWRGDYYYNTKTEKLIYGATVYNKKGRMSDVYLARALFSSKEQILSTMWHEMQHVQFRYYGLPYSSEQEHAFIYARQAKQAYQWGLKTSGMYFKKSIDCSPFWSKDNYILYMFKINILP